jgi:GntR family transcriptional regulator
MDMIAHLAPGDWLTDTGGPLYLQLRRRLESGIEVAALQGNDPLPSERDIARITGLSRVTVRKAIETMAEDGLIVQRQGSGSYVAPKPRRMEQSLSQLTSFTEDMARRGMVTTALWLERGVFLPTAQEAATLGLGPTDSVARLSRLRLADGKPLALERASLPASLLPNPVAVDGSLYQALGELGLRPVRAMQRISAANMKGSDAAFLEVAEGTAGLQIERISYLPDGRPVEMVRSLYRGAACDFVAELRLDAPEG